MFRFLLFLNANFWENSCTKCFKQWHCFLPKVQISLFSEVSFHFKTKQTKKENPEFYHRIASSLRLGSLWTATGVVVVQSPVVDPRQWTLKKIAPFQRKLNELHHDVSLASKLCLTFQIQYFEVLVFVAFKCQFFREFPYQIV